MKFYRALCVHFPATSCPGRIVGVSTPLPFYSHRSQQDRQTYRRQGTKGGSSQESKSNRAVGHGVTASKRRTGDSPAGGPHRGGKWRRRRRDSRQHTLVPISPWYMLKYSTPLPLFSRRKLPSIPLRCWLLPENFCPCAFLSLSLSFVRPSTTH